MIGIGIQTNAGYIGFVQSILKNDKPLYSATGLHSIKLLDTLTTCYDRISVESGYKPFLLCTRDRILMTMVKIKLAITFSALAVLFELVVQTCSNYFFDTVLILEEILRCVIFWPSKEDVLKNMPRCFS